MAKTFFSDYSKHMIRFYLSTTCTTPFPPKFRSVVDKENWFACKTAFDNLTDKQVFALRAIYLSSGDLVNQVYHTSQRTGFKQKALWGMMRQLEKDVACKRGLV